jgi:hypothetical protein
LIYFKPFLGLANRMYAINSAFALSKIFNVSLNIIWVKDLKLNAKFSNLFLVPKYHLFRLSEPTLSIYSLPFTLRFPTYMYFVKSLLKLKHSNSLILNDPDNNIINLTKLNLDKDIFIAAYNNFLQCEFDRSLFQPTEKIMDEVNNISCSFNKSTYGIHIRRTDNPLSIDLSPTNLFIQEIESIISADNDAKFYLASDSKNEKEFLFNKYKDRIITSLFDTSRQSSSGMKNAVVDMFVLSRTKSIIGSYFSSFSEVASLIGEIPLKIVQR